MYLLNAQLTASVHVLRCKVTMNVYTLTKILFTFKTVLKFGLQIEKNRMAKQICVINRVRRAAGTQRIRIGLISQMNSNFEIFMETKLNFLIIKYSLFLIRPSFEFY